MIDFTLQKISETVNSLVNRNTKLNRISIRARVSVCACTRATIRLHRLR